MKLEGLCWCRGAREERWTVDSGMQYGGSECLRSSRKKGGAQSYSCKVVLGRSLRPAY
jgi:hypothetical protein